MKAPLRSSAILWTGPSRINGYQVAVVVTGLRGLRGRNGGSSNRKTGRMAQVHIVQVDVDPRDRSANGREGVCGTCAFGSGGCYVEWSRGPLSAWKAFHAGRYAQRSPEDVAAQLRETGQKVRLGASGDPYAAPDSVWVALTQGVAGWTGYTHQWVRPDAQGLRGLLMASCEHPGQKALAARMGWSTFLAGEDVEGIECPASETYKARFPHKAVSCDSCGLCCGTARGQRHIGIAVHGGAVSGRKALAVVRALAAQNAAQNA